MAISNEELIIEGLKMIQSGKIKTAVDELNNSVITLYTNLNGLVTSMSALNRGVDNSNIYLKEIAELNKAASRQTNAIYILTLVTVIVAILQLLIIKGVL